MQEHLVELLLEKISHKSLIDFVFYLGNDSSDEPVYELLKSKKANEKFFHAECSKYICVLEKKPSYADYYIEDLESVRPLLEKFATKTKQRKKVRSYSDLTKLQSGPNPLDKNKLSSRLKHGSISNVSFAFLIIFYLARSIFQLQNWVE